MQGLLTVEDAKARLQSGATLLLAGDERLLRGLPRGRWIGGTIPYFVGANGGTFDERRVFATELPAYCGSGVTRVYRADGLSQVFADAPPNGFSFVIIPATSSTHLSFALNARDYPLFATRPLVGWISGVRLDEIGRTLPRVFDGVTGEAFEDAAVVMHVPLPAGKVADVRILNVFEAGGGEPLRFPKTAFQAKEAIVGGRSVAFADYVAETGIDTRLPLVSEYHGARINTSFQKVDRDAGVVSFYAPVFDGVDYHPARPVGDYIHSFLECVPQHAEGEVVFSCNCILNYLYSELEGKKTGPFVGPITFGEVAYQLVNQTLAYLAVMES